MSKRPLILDLFCGAGGAAVGYERAGFDLVGIDINPQPNYPFEFIQADALAFLSDVHYLNVLGDYPFAAYHASPPCQFKTQMAASHRSRGFDSRPDLLTSTRARLRELGKPYVIENVVGAKNSMAATLVLHGGMFGLGVHRPRLFECSELILAPTAPMTSKPVGVYGQRPAKSQWTRLNGNMSGKRSDMNVARSLAEAQQAMGIDWMTWDELKEAIPPAYTEYIGRQLLEHLAVPASP